jgi:hypothetical protein
LICGCILQVQKMILLAAVSVNPVFSIGAPPLLKSKPITKPAIKIPIRTEITPHLVQKIFCPVFDMPGVSFILDIPFTLALLYLMN